MQNLTICPRMNNESIDAAITDHESIALAILDVGFPLAISMSCHRRSHTPMRSSICSKIPDGVVPSFIQSTIDDLLIECNTSIFVRYTPRLVRLPSFIPNLVDC